LKRNEKAGVGEEQKARMLGGTMARTTYRFGGPMLGMGTIGSQGSNGNNVTLAFQYSFLVGIE
jgi:hypothetical protein